MVYDWAIAFLNSYRTFNPDLRLILIPFNDQCDRLLKLQDTYNFEIYTDPSFERLEAIGKAFELGHTPTGPYWFRRYAAYWGACDPVHVSRCPPGGAGRPQAHHSSPG